MSEPSFRSVATALSGRLPRPGLGAAAFGAGLYLAFALLSHLLANDGHPASSPAAAVDEARFLKENDDPMTKMMNDMEIIHAKIGLPPACQPSPFVEDSDRRQIRQPRLPHAHSAIPQQDNPLIQCTHENFAAVSRMQQALDESP